MPPQIYGVYEYTEKRIVMYHDAWAPYEVVFHEGAHQLMHYYTVKRRSAVNTYWFQEGVGTYFEGYERRDGELVLNPEVNRTRLPTVQAALDDGSFVPVSRLVKMTIEDFWDWFEKCRDDKLRARLAQLYYAESWALVYFMLHGEDGRYRKAFEEYLGFEFRGEGTIENFEQTLRDQTGLDLAAFQERFIDYVTRLK
jgi:hypothetical protein